MFCQRENSNVKMAFILCLLISTYLCFLDAVHLLPDDARIPTLDLIGRQGYPAERRIATTADGYRLELHRMPQAQRAQPRRVALLVHGLGGSSSDYVIMGPKRSLAYLLWDAGYDVWLGNLRGNFYTSHASFERDSPQFWNYSYHEHGKYDLPAIIDTALAVTKSKRLLYVGYSMGCSSFFVMTSERPEYNDRVIAFVGLAPAVYIDAQRPIASITYEIGVIEKFWDKGVHAVTAPQPIIDATVGTFCRAKKPSHDICMRIFYIYVGEDYEQADWDLIPTIMGRFQPLSLMQIMHFQHTSITGVFGTLSAKPNETTPYNFSTVRVPVSIFYGENDQLVDKYSVQKLVNDLKAAGTQTVLLTRVGWLKFNHLDFVFAKDLGKLLNADLVRHINKLFKLYNK